MIILRIGIAPRQKRADAERENMNTTAITLKAMQNTSEKEFGKIARAQYGDIKTIEEKKEFVIGQVGEDICDNMPDEFFEHTYRAMCDYGMDFYESDRWAWLNTLFGYDIGADRARGIINWYYENGIDVLEITDEERSTLQNIAELELGYHFDFTSFATEMPDVVSYTWQPHK